MEFKVVISDPETGKSYQRELKEDKANALANLRVGDEIDGALVGLPTCKVKISGGSDKSGFPMKKGLPGTKRTAVLMIEGVGYNPERDERRRKLVRGERIADDIAQVNVVVTKKGAKTVEEILGVKAEAGEEAAKEEKK